MGEIDAWHHHCDCLDYPVSWAFWRAHCWEVHGFDPGDCGPRSGDTGPDIKALERANWRKERQVKWTPFEKDYSKIIAPAKKGFDL